MTQCEDKTGRYKTGAKARQALNNIRRRSEHREKKPVDYYFCEFCHHFHLTSNPR